MIPTHKNVSILSLKSLALVLLLALTPAALLAQNAVAVQGAAALNGTNFGLAVQLDGSTNNTHVEDQTPADETVYRATFWIDPNSINMAAFDRTAILELRRDSPNAIIGRVQLQVNAFGGYQVRAFCLNNAGQQRFARVGGVGNKFIVVGDQPSEVTFETRYLNSNQGLCRLSAQGQTIFADGYQAGNYNVDRARFGAQNPKPTMNGSFYLDEFSSFRTLAP